MTPLLLHPHTKIQYDSLVKNPAHAIIVSGNSGAGKYTTALELISKILGVSNPYKHPFFVEIMPIDTNERSITIEQIRSIKEFLKRKTYGDNSFRRAVLISSADMMNETAQNALLKTLEEPPNDTLIVLTVSTISKLLQTIQSRSQVLDIKPIDKKNSTIWFQKTGKYSTAEIEKAYAISNGDIGLMSAILNNASDHPLLLSIKYAKEILLQTPYQRLSSVDRLCKEKNTTNDLLKGLFCTLLGATRSTVSSGNYEQAKQYKEKALLVQKAQILLLQNSNSKLVLTDLFLAL